jgi:hypothetical protein
MFLRSRCADHRALTVLGMGALTLANLTHWLWHPVGAFQVDIADGVFGVLMGMAIALLLLAGRRRSCAGGSSPG